MNKEVIALVCKQKKGVFIMGILKEKISKEISNSPQIITQLKSIFEQDVPYNHDFSTFTTTDIPNELKKFMSDVAEMNIAISPKAFPSIKKMEKECIDFIAKLFHAQADEQGNKNYIGVATVGSSEACIMAGISMLFNWRKKNDNKLKENIVKPNLIISDAYQICWKKFTDMFGVELRLVHTDDKCRIKIDELETAIDENTIGIVALFANTLTGCYDNIEDINSLVGKIKGTRSLCIPVHVDAASGGFYAPFVTPNLPFDFRLENITSVSVSGHKFGLVPPSIGWLIFRNDTLMNSPLKNELDYLGGGMLKDIGINFSKSGMPLVAQYFLIKVLGFDGYKELITKVDDMSKYMESELKKIPNLNIIAKGDISTVIYNVDGIDMGRLECLLREKYHWQVPTYTLPNSNIICQRLVIRTDVTMDLANKFVADLKESICCLSQNV